MAYLNPPFGHNGKNLSCKFEATNLISSNLTDSDFIHCDFSRANLIAPFLKTPHSESASYLNMEGDSLRATFRSAKSAVECAWMTRHVLMAAEFELRIGIDLGEVTIVIMR
jgi:hypothetical protein